jgi:hypothetical protein
MTPAQVLSTVRNQLYETTAAFWTDSELYAYMWMGEMEIAQSYQCTDATTATTTVTNTSMYTMPASAMVLQRVVWNGVKLKRLQDQTDRDALDSPSYSGTLTTGNCTHYYEYGSTIGLWPVPIQSHTIQWYYSKEPDEVTALSTFTVPMVFHRALPDYVLYRAYSKDSNEGQSIFHKKLWEEALEKTGRAYQDSKLTDLYPVVRDEDNYPNTELGII